VGGAGCGTFRRTCARRWSGSSSGRSA
jgi:hypothetical protein